MGALFFGLFMAALFFIAVGLFITSVVLLIIFILKKRKNKKVSKALPVFTGIAFIISFILITIPLAWIMMLRIANQTTYDDYKDTGIMLSLSSKEKSTGFEFQNHIYTPIKLNKGNVNLDKAIANVKNQKGLIIAKLFNYNEIETIYTVTNESGYQILYLTGNFYCKKTEYDKIINYYNNMEEYQYYLFDYNDETQESNKIHIDFSKDLFSEIIALYGNDQPKTAIKLKDIDTELNIYQTSPDGLYAKSISIMFTDDSAYLQSSFYTESGVQQCDGYKINDSTAGLLKSLLKS